MTIRPWYYAAYRQHLVEQEHAAFLRWVTSAYRNIVLWYAWQEARDRLQAHMARATCK